MYQFVYIFDGKHMFLVDETVGFHTERFLQLEWFLYIT